MELTTNFQNKSNPRIIILQNCRSSDSDLSESEKKKLNTKVKPVSSFDSENFQDSSLEISNFSDEKLNDNQKKIDNKKNKLSSIPENGNAEENSSIVDRNETGSKAHFIELMKSSQQIGDKTTNRMSSEFNCSPIFWNKNKNIQQKVFFTDKKNEIVNTKNNVNENNELEVDGINIKLMSNQCICTSASCSIF